ncbi:hypothetical protein [Sulfitobacter sp. SK012]|uniref:hypothetical protein n=1 Tax=Sulfitobacter sp. SK012 TaxID=1389005 RepID=UPI0013B41AEA|nr:hypothetical protein [Sulfitobacter sp. SK012]
MFPTTPAVDAANPVSQFPMSKDRIDFSIAVTHPAPMNDSNCVSSYAKRSAYLGPASATTVAWFDKAYPKAESKMNKPVVSPM